MSNLVRQLSAQIAIIFYYERGSLTAFIRRAVLLLFKIGVKKWGQFNGVISNSLKVDVNGVK